MKKNIARVAATVVLLLALFNVIAFAIPFVRTPVFWLAYAFTSAAIVAQLPLSLYAFTPKGGARDSLYGFPIAQLALVYLLAQAVVGLLCMALSVWIPLWAALVVKRSSSCWRPSAAWPPPPSAMRFAVRTSICKRTSPPCANCSPAPGRWRARRRARRCARS